MDLFEIAYKEYLDSVGPEEPDEEIPEQQFCSEGRKHQFINNRIE
jgi:hypothetical protein